MSYIKEQKIELKDEYAPASEVTFPLWVNPLWRDAEGRADPNNNNLNWELFSDHGKYCGLVEPFGTIWKVSYPLIHTPAPGITLCTLGFWYTLEQAKKALELYHGVEGVE